jgi:threonine/homoserine/homoserine lactone efflux protein
MLDWSSLAIFVLVVLIIVATPGPNTLYIIARSLHGGYYAGLASCLGILAATLTHIIVDGIRSLLK